MNRSAAVSLDATFDAFPDLLFLVSPAGIILDFRGGRSAPLYAAPDAFLGRPIHAVLPAPVAAQLTEAIARACDTQLPVAIDYSLPMPDGEHTFEARLVPLRPDAILAVCRDVTEDVRTRDRLKRDEAERVEMLSLLRSTLDSTADGIVVVDGHGRVITSNRKFAEMWRIPAEMIDSHDEDRTLAFMAVQLADPETFVTQVRELYACPDAERFDLLAFRDGRAFERYSQPRYVEGASVGRVWSFRDVTARVRAESALQESEGRFRQLTESLDDIFWLRDVATERILYVSPAFESIVGRPVASLYEHPRLWIESVHPDDRSGVADLYLAWHKGETHERGTLTYRIVRPDGAIRWLLDTITPIEDPQGRVYRVGGVATDITARRADEDARRQFQTQLLQAQEMQALGTMANGIAHNFNNALTVVIGNTQMAQRLVPRYPAVRECLDAVLEASGQAQALVRRIDAFARPSAGERRVVDPGPIVKQAVDLLQATLPATIPIALTVDADTPAVLADPTEIQQIVLNLALNAAQAMADHGTVEIAVGKLDASPELVVSEGDLRVGPYATISVTDGGSGMDAPTKRRIFEPFFTTKAPGDATGLGLSVVHGIVARQGGKIRVWSERGVGSRFEVCLQAWTDAPSSLSLNAYGELLSMRPNLLIEGPPEVTDTVVRALARYCSEPMAYWGDNLGDERPSTLVVRDIGSLSATDQRRLQRWLAIGTRVQVVSTTPQPLFPLVARGQFLAQLYYRLNVLRLDVRGGSLRAP